MKRKIILLTVSVLGFVLAKANSSVDPDVHLGRKDDLVGVVVNSENKKPLKDVSVTAYSTTKKEKVAVTDESGNFSFDELKPGTYKFIFEKTGFRKVTKEKIIVKTDEAFQMNIEMIESNELDLKPSPFHFISVK
ncbi:MAG TPA: carboxypeptidase-like regulatory domain-containing protein [Chitinophagaceae bacterium]|nr:carboxypeptidase-like regulatory domain-containing protein [Chitinophagaceae bacterium]